MSSSSITNPDRNQVCNTLSALFDRKLASMIDRYPANPFDVYRGAVGEKVYDDLVAFDQAHPGWMTTSRRMAIELPADVTFYIDAPNIPARPMFLPSITRGNPVSGLFSTIGWARANLPHEVTAWTNTYLEQMKRVEWANKKVQEYTNQFTTTGQMRRVWPALLPFMPYHKRGSSKGRVPHWADKKVYQVIAAINRMIAGASLLPSPEDNCDALRVSQTRAGLRVGLRR